MRYFNFSPSLSGDLEYAYTLKFWGLQEEAFKLLLEVARDVEKHPVGTKEYTETRYGAS